MVLSLDYMQGVPIVEPFELPFPPKIPASQTPDVQVNFHGEGTKNSKAHEKPSFLKIEASRFLCTICTGTSSERAWGTHNVHSLFTDIFSETIRCKVDFGMCRSSSNCLYVILLFNIIAYRTIVLQF